MATKCALYEPKGYSEKRTTLGKVNWKLSDGVFKSTPPAAVCLKS